jgi:hypothetical protein
MVVTLYSSGAAFLFLYQKEKTIRCRFWKSKELIDEKAIADAQ